MMSRARCVFLGLVTVVLAGCVSSSEPQAVDFENVGPTQRGAGGNAFDLRVKVVGLDANGTQPLADAFVGAAAQGQALAKARTGSDGWAALALQRDQTLRLVAQAAGWTTEDSGRIGINERPQGGPSQPCVATGVAAAYPDAPWYYYSYTLPCVSVDSDEDPGLWLDGDDGVVTLLLFPARVAQSFPVGVSPHVNLAFVALPDGRWWFPEHRALNEDPQLHRLQMLRLAKVHGTLLWTNELLHQADFEFGIGCGREQPDGRTDGGLAQNHLLTQGPAKIDYDWTPRARDRWTDCPEVQAGPIVDTLSTSVTPRVALDLAFQGRSRIIPVNP